MMKLYQRLAQILSVCLYNAYIPGFFKASIYQGMLKTIPCPGLNCHSCPSALSTCPIGVLQLFVSYGTYHISLYVVGFLGAIGALGGRIICGWACPFGLLQDLVFKVPLPEIKIYPLVEKTRYVVLIGLVGVAAWITKEPWFCKAICPAGTLEAGIPLVILNSDLRDLIGGLFFFKAAVLGVLLLLMMISKRPFCRVLCPLGALYSLFNKISFFRIAVDNDACISCDACHKECPVGIRIYQEGGGSSSCVRCFRCVKDCPTKAISITRG